MALIRYALVELIGEPHPVVDAFSVDDDPEHEEYAEICVVEGFKIVESDEAQPGWTWTEEGGLMAGQD